MDHTKCIISLLIIEKKLKGMQILRIETNRILVRIKSKADC